MRTRMRGAEGPTVDVKFCLVFPREALSVPVMRHVLGDTLRDLGADDDGVADLLLAVTEACSNVVRHGGPGQRYEVLASVGHRMAQQVGRHIHADDLHLEPLRRARAKPPVPHPRSSTRCWAARPANSTKCGSHTSNN